MNKYLADEELDRELSINHFGDGIRPYMWAFHKIKYSKKNLTIENGQGEKITFQKRNFIDDGLEITSDFFEKKEEICSLGHIHSKGIEKKIVHGSMRWDYVEQLIEWLQQGSWTQVQKKEPQHRKILRECHKMFDELSKKDDMMKPVFQKMKLKIANELGEKI